MKLDKWTVAGLALLLVAVAMRVNNSVLYPVPRGYDSFGHVTYILYLLKTGQLPRADEGWSFFHPPLFFGLAAALWRAFQSLDPVRVMHIISLAFALLGLVPAGIAYLITRDYFGADKRPLLFCVTVLVMFLPVGIYTAPMIGNEGLHAVFCALAIYCLIRTLKAWNARWAAALGTALGLAFLTKFTASGLILASTLALLIAGWHRRQLRATAQLLAITLSVAFVISGWFYVRNILLFGNPFQMSRDFFFVQRIENAQLFAQRTFWDYVSFDASIFKTPAMFRLDRSVVRSVWSSLFANTWFDAFGGWFMPGSVGRPLVTWAGRVILALATVPTLLVVLGLIVALWRSVRRGWDETLVCMILVFAVVFGMYVQFTRSVAIYSALKASYLLPITLVFSFWFALGLDAVSRWPRLQATMIGLMGLLVVTIIPVFTYGRLFQLDTGSYDQNGRGVICYLAGFRERAAQLFDAAGRERLFLGHENLATLALEAGDPHRALGELLRAETLMPNQIVGTIADREVHARGLMAEYRNTRAYIYDQLGWNESALAAAREAHELDPTLAEADYNQAVLLLKAQRGAEAYVVAQRAVEAEPAFTQARALLVAVAAAQGDCAAAGEGLSALNGRPDRRSFPYQTGRGDITDAGIARRKLLRVPPEYGNPFDAVAHCRPGTTSTATAVNGGGV